jgi:class 3 adenylate cyclase
VPRLQRRSFEEPDELRPFARGKIENVSLDETVIGKLTLEPGWRWSEDVKPIVGTDSCLNRHLGIIFQGVLRVRMADGSELDLRPNDAYEIPPDHDAWVVGETPVIAYEWSTAALFARSPEEQEDGVLATLVFTDIVGSTAILERVGDRAWRDLLTAHNLACREQLAQHRGRELHTTGDGFLAMFDSAARAVRCGTVMARKSREVGLPIRLGIHTGEVMMVAGDVRGVAVHVAARVMALAGAGEIMVSSTTAELLASSGVKLESAGSFEMKGLAGEREVFRVV